MSVTSGEQLVEKYLAAYKAYDLAAMDACTDPEFTFSDPAFPSLNCKYEPRSSWPIGHPNFVSVAKQAKGMFSMFVNNREKNKMELEYKDIKKGINDLTYTATYTVRYIFTGRPVTNVIQSTFTISPTSNLLLSQVDAFPFYTWAKQALGLPGLLLGWTGYLQSQVQHNAGQSLEKYMKKAEATSS
ncbi:hypothetical protein FRC14_007723 [Serendipita sp. 396]|nr:hypothetical protein FRC14_007723 [Serendipita sp. 396]KAG8776889.1 hypothetical protein FRC15_011656 [Serendipita sp. 397]KAG8861323.1 hypothetical protein FRC20_011485 [Serendipita sp. 405]